jgi:DNA-directed RNA polymerase specialized sigma24 family protein
MTISDLHIHNALLQREADRAAARLVRRFGLARHEREDLRQEILVDLVDRLRFFDPSRGRLGAFIAMVVKHRTGRLARRIASGRKSAPLSLDETIPDSGGITLGDTVAEEDGYAALMGQSVDRFADVERRIDLERALTQLRRSDLSLCCALMDHTPAQVAANGVAGRASIYRHVHEIRMRLMAAGISAAR